MVEVSKSAWREERESVRRRNLLLEDNWEMREFGGDGHQLSGKD